MRPTSIVRFELIASATVIVSFLFSCWMMITYGFPFVSWFGTVLFAGLQFLLISFVSRRGNVIAKWTYIGLVGYSVLALLYSLYAGIKELGDVNEAIDRATLLKTIFISALYVGFQLIAASSLFREESLDWFEDKKIETIHPSDPTDMLMIAIGGIICIFIFIFINHATGLGTDCYYYGALDSTTQCINPAIYRSISALGVVLLGFGIFGRFRHQ